MKAGIIDAHGSVTVRDMPEPGTLGPYDVRCQLLYGATCTGTDSHIIGGNFPWTSPLPTVLGHESVGRVVELGEKVRHFREGDLVSRVGTPPADGISVTWGGFTQVGIAKDHWAMCADGLPPADWQGNRVNQVIPTGIDPMVAPMFTTWRATLSYMQNLATIAGRRVLIVGSGGNGLAFGAHAANLGAEQVVMVGSPRLEEAVLAKTGVSDYVSYKLDKVVDRLKELAPGGFDVIIDAVGKAGAANGVLPCLRPGGKLGIYGIDDFQNITINPLLAPGLAVDCQMHGGYDEAETHFQISEMVMQGKLDASLWYTEDDIFGLDAINEAFAYVLARKSPKALIKLQD